MMAKRRKPVPKKPSPITGTSPLVAGLFIASVVLIVIAAISMASFVVFAELPNGELLLLAIGTLCSGILASVVSCYGLFLQVRNEDNHKFDEYLVARQALDFNAGMHASEAGSSQRKSGDKQP